MLQVYLTFAGYFPNCNFFCGYIYILFPKSRRYGRVSIWHCFAEIFGTIVISYHCHKGGDKFCRHYESETVFFLHGQLESKMAQYRVISVTHICTTYYRK